MAGAALKTKSVVPAGEQVHDRGRFRFFGASVRAALRPGLYSEHRWVCPDQFKGLGWYCFRGLAFDSAMSPMLRGPIPGRLRRKVPSALLMFVDGQRFWTVFGFGVALLAIYGPLVGPSDHDGFRYLLLPVLSPWVPALYYKLRPINSYSGYRGRWHDLGGMIGKDRTDVEARRLVELLQSGEGQAAVTRLAIMSSAMLFVPMALVSIALWSSLTWTFWSRWLFFSVSMSIIGCWIAVFTQIISWGVRTWADRISEETRADFCPLEVAGRPQ